MDLARLINTAQLYGTDIVLGLGCALSLGTLGMRERISNDTLLVGADFDEN